MSNCIEIRRSEAVFKSTEIDIPKLKALVDSVRGVKEYPGSNPKTDEELRQYYAWWWLNDKNVVFGNDFVVIGFGGASAHTWRDFHGLLEVIIKPLMKKSKTHVFLMEDEGFPGWFNAKYDFQDGYVPAPVKPLGKFTVASIPAPK
jgi:hypothetical protein